MQKIIIWGAGRKGISVAKKIRSNKIKYFIDANSDKVGRYLCGYEIRAVEELYNEKEKVLLVKTVQDEMVDNVLKNWGGQSVKIDELFSLPEIVEVMDEDIYTRYNYDNSLVEVLFKDKVGNWYRSDYFDETNKQLVYAMRMNNSKAIKDILDTIYLSGKQFDEYYNVRPGMRLANRIIQSLDKDIRIADFACGHGELIMRLLEDGHKVWALDSSEDRVQYLLSHGIEASIQNVENVNYENDFFDVVICMECLEHVGNVIKTVGEIFRVLVDGGMAIITVPYMKNCDCKTHVRQFDEVKLASLFNQNFEIVNMIKMPYLNWTDDDNLFLVAKKKK